MGVAYGVIFGIDEAMLPFLQCSLHYQFSHARPVYPPHPQRMRLQKLRLLNLHPHRRPALLVLLPQGQPIRSDAKVLQIFKGGLFFLLLAGRTLLLSTDHPDALPLLLQCRAIASVGGAVVSLLAVHEGEDLGLPPLWSFCHLLRYTTILLQTTFRIAALLDLRSSPTEREVSLENCRLCLIARS